MLTPTAIEKGGPLACLAHESWVASATWRSACSPPLDWRQRSLAASLWPASAEAWLEALAN